MHFGFIIIIFVFLIFKILKGSSVKSNTAHTFSDDNGFDDLNHPPIQQDDAFLMGHQSATIDNHPSHNHNAASSHDHQHSSHDHSQSSDHSHSHSTHTDSGSDFGSDTHHDF